MTKKTFAAAILAVALFPLPAFAQAGPATPKSDSTDVGKLTIVEVLNIGQALRQMGDYYRAGGEKVSVPFKFDGTTLMTFGINVRAADDTEKAYRDAYLRFEQQELGDVKDASPEEVQKKKQAIATSDAAKRMIDRPAGALLARIKESELCMKDPPVKPCTVKNDLSPGQIAALLPIIDRGQ